MDVWAGAEATSSTTAPDLKRWLHDHAQPPPAVGMGQSIALNVATLAAGLLIFELKREWNKNPRRKSTSFSSERLLCNDRSVFEFGPGYHTTALNYLIFLRVAAELCTVLTVVSAVVVVPYWGVQPFLLGGLVGRISLAEDIDANGICLLGAVAFFFGVLVLVFAQRMKRHMRIRGAMHPKYSSCLDRTLWLSHLPVGDNLTGKYFKLSEEDFARVEENLKRAIEEHVKQKVKQEPSIIPILRVHVAFVVDDYYALDTKHQEEEDRLKTRMEHLAMLQWKDYSVRSFSCARPWKDLQIWWISRQAQKLQVKVNSLRLDLERKGKQQKRMSGSAFVTFKERRFKDVLLEDLPSCWKIQNYAHFNFGQPPFSSVTLRCQRAPHPADILWENLHIPYRQRILRFGGGSLLLLIFMLVLVTPVSVSSELNTIIPELRRGSHEIRNKVEQILGVSIPEKGDAVWQWLYLQLPPMVILFINSLVLPYLIGEICHFQRNHTLSKAELNQMNMNYVFMVMNQLLIPLLGLTGIPALLEFLEVKLHDEKEDISILQLLDGSMLRSPGLFYVRYLLNCTFLTNTNSLLNLPQLFVRWLTSTPEPWNFAWGYWYAATLGILTTAVSLGVLVPSLLPIAALFFAMKYCVDSHILNTRAYRCGPESQGLFLPRVLFIMRMIAVGSWLVVFSSLHVTAKTYFQHRWDARVPYGLLQGACWLLVASAIFMAFFFFWAKGNDVHNAKFQFLRYSVGKKDLERNLVDRCFDSIFGKLHQAVDSATVHPKRNYSEEAVVSTVSLNFSRRDSAEMEECQSDEAMLPALTSDLLLRISWRSPGGFPASLGLSEVALCMERLRCRSKLASRHLQLE
ncbi:CSC1-like protein 1 (Transmembrane protein 63A) [Durusdinium trenchii]|uniref:CSC1-like protein 1 (Transmembrane protein 63A) n=1 Tax=Durusdinium trenchii TaxID=1381693 RepID=A0ABP0J8A8_9DINO